MSERKSIHKNLRLVSTIAVVLLAVLVTYSKAYAQPNPATMNPQQIIQTASSIPIEQFNALISQLKPEQIQQIKILLSTPMGKEALAKLPPTHQEAINKLLQQKSSPGNSDNPSAAPFIPTLPTGKPVKLYLYFKNNMIIEAVTKEREEAKKAEVEEKIKNNETPYYMDGKYLPGVMEFVAIPAGSFLMGSNISEKGHLADELRHEVQLTAPFWMSCFEVTQEQWIAVMGTSAVNVVTLPPIEGSMEIPTLTRGDGYPMFNITYEEAMEFCKRLTEQYRLAAQKLDKKTYYKLPEDLEFSLPTEAQWEYACRAGTQTPYSTGEVLLAREANYNVVKIKEQVVVTTNDNNNNNWGEPGENNNNQKKEKKVRFHEKNYIPRLHVVGVGNPNAFGLFDMHGNVWEWCKGCYYPYSQQKAVDPKGLRSGALNVVRGGSWYSIERDCRSARRWDIDGKTRQNNIGFRVVIIKK